MKTNEFINKIDAAYPYKLAMENDNSGVVFCDMEANVRKVLVALDITEAVINEAASFNCDFILSHHPLIYSPLYSVDSERDRMFFLLVKNRINAVSAHTNLDIARGGVNDALAAALAIENAESFEIKDEGKAYMLGRIGNISEMKIEEFVLLIKKRLGIPCVKYTKAGEKIKRVAVLAGGAADYIKYAKLAGADTLVTGDVKYRHGSQALSLGLNLIDAGHFQTENVVMPVLYDFVISLGLECIISNASKGYFEYL